MNWVRQTLGTILGAFLAIWTALVFHRTQFRSFLPVIFIMVLALLASKFGTWSGILSTIVTAIVFAEFLFGPGFSLRMSSSAEKNNWVWMVIGGIALSEVLGLPPRESNVH